MSIFIEDKELRNNDTWDNRYKPNCRVIVEISGGSEIAEILRSCYVSEPVEFFLDKAADYFRSYLFGGDMSKLSSKKINFGDPFNYSMRMKSPKRTDEFYEKFPNIRDDLSIWFDFLCHLMIIDGELVLSVDYKSAQDEAWGYMFSEDEDNALYTKIYSY